MPDSQYIVFLQAIFKENRYENGYCKINRLFLISPSIRAIAVAMSDPTPIIQSLIAGLPVLLLHLGTATAVWAGALLLYIWITPHRELALIREGNEAAAISFGGAAIGLAVPLAFCLRASLNVWDILIWGSVILILQLIAFRVLDFMLKDLPKRIENDERAAAIFLAMSKFAVAALNAAAVSG